MVLQSDAASRVQRLFALASRRVGRAGHQEHPIFRVPLDRGNAALMALTDLDSALTQAVQAAGCTFVSDGEQLTVQAQAAVAREVGRRLLLRLQSKGQIKADTAQRLLEGLRRDVDREVVRAGRDAMAQAGLKRLHPDLLKLLGSLTFRTSFGQNQLKHALEVADLAGMLAAELGLHVRQAQRAGLLHDIGKSLTHTEGAGGHAVLGAREARRCGEPEAVANAIGAHHHDEAAQGPLAYVVAAADALSGARPGARRDAMEAYWERLAAIEAAVRQHPEVQGVDIAAGGREVRVAVGQAAPSDGAGLQTWTAQLGAAIRAQVRTPGEMRITVVRTTVATSLARRGAH